MEEAHNHPEASQMMEKVKEHRLNGSLGFVINAVAREMRTRLESALKPFNVTPTGWLVMLGLAEQQETNQSEVGRMLMLDNATITRQIDKLEEAGLIQRMRDLHDRRVQMVELTGEGRNLLPRLNAEATRINRQALEGLSESDSRKFMDILNLIMKNLNNREGEVVS